MKNTYRDAINTILIGADQSMEMIPPHKLLNTLHLVLSHLVYDTTTTPQQLVDAMGYTASIIEHMGPPTVIVKDPGVVLI